MDNDSFHKGKVVQKIIYEAEHTYIPSPTSRFKSNRQKLAHAKQKHSLKSQIVVNKAKQVIYLNFR